jgi:hypothetical protein
MNDKLRAWEGKMSEKVRHGHCGARNRTDALVAMRKNSEGIRGGKKNGRDIMRVTFHERMDALTGWKKGDTLDMEITGDRAVVYRSDRGVALCNSGPDGRRTYIRFSFPTGSLADLPTGDCREVEAKPGRVAFLLPVATE